MPNTGPEGLVHVAVGVIVGSDRRILLSRRPDHVHQGGLWEFPGGKVEAGESVHQALDRELREELDIGLVRGEALLEVRHDYSDKSVLLDVYLVWEFSGEPRGLEGQPLYWARIEDLAELSFPAANEAIVAAVSEYFS